MVIAVDLQTICFFFDFPKHYFTAGFVQNSSIRDLLETSKEPNIVERFMNLEDLFQAREQELIQNDYSEADLVL